MWLILCSREDTSALWAYTGLQARGLMPLELVTADMLTHNAKWEHRVGTDGAYINITLADGRVIDNRKVHGVLNRLTHVPLQHLTGAPDFEYASQEYSALFMSWLNALPKPIFNGAAAQGLSGAWRHISEWVWLAAQAGLPTPQYKQTSHDSIDESKELRRLLPAGTPTMMVITVGDRVIASALPPAVRQGCVELARLSETPLLGIEFAVAPDTRTLVFAGATPVPDLQVGGEAVLDALAVKLYQGERGQKS
jgi:hypothetical protein